MKTIHILAGAVTIASLSGCWANLLDEEARQVVLVNSLPAEFRCSFKGEVVGAQGNALTGAITTNKTLVTGARNDLRNEAAKLGANIVVITDTLSDLNEGQSVRSLTYIGKAYTCEK